MLTMNIAYISSILSSDNIKAGRASTNSDTSPTTATSVGDGVASGVSQRRGRSPGHCDISGTTLDCHHVSRRERDCKKHNYCSECEDLAGNAYFVN